MNIFFEKPFLSSTSSYIPVGSQEFPIGLNVSLSAKKSTDFRVDFLNLLVDHLFGLVMYKNRHRSGLLELYTTKPETDHAKPTPIKQTQKRYSLADGGVELKFSALMLFISRPLLATRIKLTEKQRSMKTGK